MEHVVGLVAYREEVSRHLDQGAVPPFPFPDDSGGHLAETREKDGFGFGKNGDHKADQCSTLRPLQDQSIAWCENEVGICPCRLERAILESKLRSELQRLGSRDHRRGKERPAGGQSAKGGEESGGDPRTRSRTPVWAPFPGDPDPRGRVSPP